MSRLHVFAVSAAHASSLRRQGYLTLSRGSAAIERGDMVELVAKQRPSRGRVILVTNDVYIIEWVGGENE